MKAFGGVDWHYADLKTDYSSLVGPTIIIHTLFVHREYGIGLIVLLFTIVFPLWKFGVFCESARSAARGRSLSGELRPIEKFGRFSMLDVYVLALLVISIKGLPGGSLVHLRWGLVPFVAAIVLTMRMPQWVSEIIKQK